MGRIVIAILFVFAVAAQSASLSGNQDGFRLPAVAAQPARLTEYAECDDTDHLLLLSVIIVPATSALERLAQLVFLQQHRRPHQFDRDRVPLYELHTVWRI